MRPAHVIEIVTPKKVRLNGLWLGPRRAKRVVVWIHGLGSSMFSKLDIVGRLIDTDTAVVMFNNRGHDKVASVIRTTGNSIKAGAAHEVFTDCVDDIEGALRFTRAAGAKKVFLAGHSTGCQKSVYWSARRGRGVKGIILLAPMSDYSTVEKEQGKKRVAAAEKYVRTLVVRGKKFELIPEAIWPPLDDAQRFLSLYTGEGPEEIFTYWDQKRTPKTLRSVRKPLLVLLAECDEFQDRPARKIGDWFAKHLKLHDKVVVVPKVQHGFKGGERAVAKAIRRFMLES